MVEFLSTYIRHGQFLVFGFWFLVFGFWFLVFGPDKNRDFGCASTFGNIYKKISTQTQLNIFNKLAYY